MMGPWTGPSWATDSCTHSQCSSQHTHWVQDSCTGRACGSHHALCCALLHRQTVQQSTCSGLQTLAHTGSAVVNCSWLQTSAQTDSTIVNMLLGDKLLHRQAVQYSPCPGLRTPAQTDSAAASMHTGRQQTWSTFCFESEKQIQCFIVARKSRKLLWYAMPEHVMYRPQSGHDAPITKQAGGFQPCKQLVGCQHCQFMQTLMTACICALLTY